MKEKEGAPLLHGSSISCSVTVRCKDPGWGLRHVFLILANMGACLVYSMRVNLSVALVAMVNHTAVHATHGNESTGVNECVDETNLEVSAEAMSSVEGEFVWSAATQGLILAAVFYGYITTPILSGWVADRFSAKAVITASLTTSSFLTLTTPLAAYSGAAALVAVRILIGVAQGFFLSAMYVLLARWSHPVERSKFATLVVIGCDIGTTTSQPITGLLCEYGFAGGWPSVFYVFGSAGMVWVVLWVLLVHDSPALHPWITFDERAYLLEKVSQGDEKKPNPPYLSILTSLPFWALAFAHFARNWGYLTLLTTLPTFMAAVLNFDISKNGVFSALPYLAMLTAGLLAGQIADFCRSKKILSTTHTRKIINTIALCGSAAFLVTEGYIHCDRLVAIIMLCCSTAFLGLNYGGAFINHLDIAPRFAGTLMGITNTIATIPGVVSPLIVSTITDNSSDITKWRIVFYITGAIYVAGAAVFLLFASGREQHWAKESSYSYIPGENDDKPGGGRDNSNIPDEIIVSANASINALDDKVIV